MMPAKRAVACLVLWAGLCVGPAFLPCDWPNLVEHRDRVEFARGRTEQTGDAAVAVAAHPLPWSIRTVMIRLDRRTESRLDSLTESPASRRILTVLAPLFAEDPDTTFLAIHTSYGWPFQAVSSLHIDGADGDRVSRRFASVGFRGAGPIDPILRFRLFPTHIEWPGCAGNLVVAASVVIATSWAASCCRRILRRRAGRCVACGYPSAAGAVACSECGAVSTSA